MQVILGWLPQPIGGMAVVQQTLFDSFYAFVTHDTNDRKIFGGYTFASCGYIPSGRNTLVRTFLDKTVANYLLMLDWDITFAPEDVYQLVDFAEEDPLHLRVVSGCYVTYFGEDNALRPCWMGEEDGVEHVPVKAFAPGEVIPLSVVGMGFTLVHRDAFLRMEKAGNDDPWPWYGHDLIDGNRTGEDVTFCHRARRCGLTIWGHGGVQLGHTKAKTLSPRDMLDPAFATSQPYAPFTPAPDVVTKRVLNVGGGSKEIPLPECYAGWDHVLLDIKHGPDVDIAMDARELANRANHYATTQYNWSKVAENSYDAVYCSHNIEHYEVHDVGLVLRGMCRVLKPGGTVELHCPNFEEVFERVDSGAGLDDIAYQSSVGPIRYRDIIFGYEKEIEESGEPFYKHKTAITPAFLMSEMKRAGFEEVQIVVDGLEMAAVARKREEVGDAVDQPDPEQHPAEAGGTAG